MNFRRYLFDRVPLLLLLFIFLLISFVYLVLYHIPGRIVLPLFLLWILFFEILLYVGMILICACAAILAVRQISDTLQHRYRYQILSHLGFSEKRTDRYLRHQLFVYFGVPLLLPLPLSVFTSLCLHDLMRPYVADTQVFLYACLSIGIFLLIYSIYLAATYIGCRKNIQEGWHPLD